VLYERRVELKSLALKRLGKLYYVFHNYDTENEAIEAIDRHGKVGIYYSVLKVYLTC